MVERIFQIFVGLVLFVAGAGIIYAFHNLDWHKGHDIWDVGFLLIAEAYSVAGSLFILLGLRYALGRQSFIERNILRSLRHFAVAVVLLSLAFLVAFHFQFEMKTWPDKLLQQGSGCGFRARFTTFGPTWLNFFCRRYYAHH